MVGGGGVFTFLFVAKAGRLQIFGAESTAAAHTSCYRSAIGCPSQKLTSNQTALSPKRAKPPTNINSKGSSIVGEGSPRNSETHTDFPPVLSGNYGGSPKKIL